MFIFGVCFLLYFIELIIRSWRFQNPKQIFSLKRRFSYRAAKSWNELSSETIDNYENLSISRLSENIILHSKTKRNQIIFMYIDLSFYTCMMK